MPKKEPFIHPHLIMIYLLMAGITMLFVGMLIAYGYTRVSSGADAIKLPWIFYVSTLILMFASRLLKRAEVDFEEEHANDLQKKIALALSLSIVFLILQALGWYQLITMGFPIEYSNMSSYLYVISAAHLAHILAGLPFLVIFLRRLTLGLKDEFGGMLLFADGDYKRHLNILKIYWTFLDYLWIALMLFFLLNYFIRF